jgi:hypothetical protein
MVRALVLGLLVVGCSARHPSPPASGDSGFAAMQQRGRMVMGVDQYTSSHVFESLPDGGRIILVRDSTDSAGVAMIRAHLRSIAAAFARGDFTMPEQVHAESVPGTAVMAARSSRIRYVESDRPGGGQVRIVTDDSAVIAAVHEFLEYQRQAHHAAAHDSVHPAHHQ